MGLRAGLDWCGKSRPPPRFDSRTVQPIGSRYTDYATRPTNDLYFSLNMFRVIKVRTRLAGHVARMGGKERFLTDLVGKCEGKKPFGRSWNRWEDSVKINLQ